MNESIFGRLKLEFSNPSEKKIILNENMPTVVELKNALRKAGLKVTGTKSELENRVARARAGALTSGNKGRGAVASKSSSKKPLSPPHRQTAPPTNATTQRVMPKGVPALREYAKSLGLKTTGSTTELEQRIRRAWAGATRNENRPGAKAAPAPKRRVLTPPSPAPTDSEAAKIVEQIKRLVVEYQRLPAWSSMALTPENIDKRRMANDGGVVVGGRGIATKNDVDKVEILREIYDKLQRLPSSRGTSPNARKIFEFTRIAETEFKREVERAPKELRLKLQHFEIKEMNIEEFAKMGR